MGHAFKKVPLQYVGIARLEIDQPPARGQEHNKPPCRWLFAFPRDRFETNRFLANRFLAVRNSNC
jgi:hypothetical protein